MSETAKNDRKRTVSMSMPGCLFRKGTKGSEIAGCIYCTCRGYDKDRGRKENK